MMHKVMKNDGNVLHAIAAGPNSWNSHPDNNAETIVRLRDPNSLAPWRHQQHGEFRDLVFNGPLLIEHTTFGPIGFEFIFHNCTFRGGLHFSHCTVDSEAIFLDCTFHEDLRIEHCRFSAAFQLNECELKSNIDIDNCNFADELVIDDSEVGTEIQLSNSTISANLILQNIEVGDAITLVSGRVAQSLEISSLLSRSEIVIIDCRIEEGLEIFADDDLASAIIASTTISGRTMIGSTNVRGNFSFSENTVNSVCHFGDVEFHGQADFSSSSFLGPLILSGSTFCDVPDFRRTSISHHLSLHDIQVNVSKTPAEKSRGHSDAARSLEDKLRRLKDMAKRAEDHDKELHFFAEELRARRQTSRIDGALIANYAYEIVSNFGRSFLRPLIALILLWVVSSCAYAFIGAFACKKDFSAPILSLMQMMPFLTSSRLIDYKWDELFEGPWNHIAAATGFAQGILSAVFIFLALLALRNKFRL